MEFCILKIIQRSLKYQGKNYSNMQECSKCRGCRLKINKYYF